MLIILRLWSILSILKQKNSQRIYFNYNFKLYVIILFGSLLMKTIWDLNFVELPNFGILVFLPFDFFSLILTINKDG